MGSVLRLQHFSKNEFQADVMHETLNRTSLKMLKPGSSVNLERPWQRTAGLEVISYRGILMELERSQK